MSKNENSKMFLKRSAYHVTKTNNLNKALGKAESLEAAMKHLAKIRKSYRRVALMAAMHTLSKNYHFTTLKQAVDFMTDLAELPKDVRKQIIQLVKFNTNKADSDNTSNMSSDTTDNSNSSNDSDSDDNSDSSVLKNLPDNSNINKSNNRDNNAPQDYTPNDSDNK